MRRGLAPSRQVAAELVERGVVLVRGAVADKPARLVAAGDALQVTAPPRRFVSRGGEKLEAALDRFGIPVYAKRCLDAGASTGGFTDCLLQRGAAHVTAVDVARGKIDPGLRDDPRVQLLERTNVRHLEARADDEQGFDVVVADLSFISLTVVMDVLSQKLARTGADLILLVKPQFEVGREVASRSKGVVKDPELRLAALEKVARSALASGATILGAMASPLLGPSGNAEFLLHARARSDRGSPVVGGPGPTEISSMLAGAVAEAPDRHERANEQGCREEDLG